jgi:hypothetical protein
MYYVVKELVCVKINIEKNVKCNGINLEKRKVYFT